MCRILLAHGADVNAQDEEELTPLHVAARDGYGECVLLLCKAGADVYKTNCENKTAKVGGALVIHVTHGVVRQDLADMATQQDTVTFLAKCETGLIPDEAPKQKVGSGDVVFPRHHSAAGARTHRAQGDRGARRLGARLVSGHPSVVHISIMLYLIENTPFILHRLL